MANLVLHRTAARTLRNDHQWVTLLFNTSVTLLGRDIGNTKLTIYRGLTSPEQLVGGETTHHERGLICKPAACVQRRIISWERSPA